MFFRLLPSKTIHKNNRPKASNLFERKLTVQTEKLIQRIRELDVLRLIIENLVKIDTAIRTQKRHVVSAPDNLRGCQPLDHGEEFHVTMDVIKLDDFVQAGSAFNARNRRRVIHNRSIGFRDAG